MMNYRGMPGYTGANLPNDQYWSTDYKPGMGNPGGTGGGGPQYNMQSASQFAPPNEGGPGNPNGANNMAKPMLPRFNPGFQNNKGPAPLQGYNPNSPAQLDQRAIAADPQGFAQWQREAAAAGYNYGNSGQQGQQGVQSGPPASLLQSFNSLMGGGQQGGYNGSGINPGFQNNKGPAPMQNWGGGPNGQWNGDFSQFANQQQGGYNGSGINPQPYGFGQGGAPTMGTYSPSVQMNQSQAPLAQHLSGLSPVQTGGSAQFNRGYSGDTVQGRQDAWQNQQQAPRQDNYYRRPSMGGDPFNQYGYAGQSPSLGRYQPPMMSNPYDPQGGWLGSGGYSYNIPNSYGSGQWNQFNSTDTANRNFGQTQNQPTLGVNQSVRQGQPQYQSPFASGDPSRSQNLLAYMQGIAQPQQKPQYTQPGAPSQPGPVT